MHHRLFPLISVVLFMLLALGCNTTGNLGLGDDDDSVASDEQDGDEEDADDVDDGDDDDGDDDDGDDDDDDDGDDDDDKDHPFAGFYGGGTYITVETRFGPELLCEGELDVVVGDDGELFGDGGCWSGDSGEWDLTFSGDVEWDGSFDGEMVAISEPTGEVQGFAQGSMDFEDPDSGFEGWVLYSLIEVDFGGGPGPGGPAREFTVVAYGE